MQVDVAIVGGGLMGTWTGFFLSRKGFDVAVIDQGRIGAAASGVNFGNLRIQGRHSSQFALSLRSQSLWERFDELIGTDCEVQRTGHLYVARDGAQMAKLEKYAGEATEADHDVELLDAGNLVKRWPWLSGPVRGGSFSSRDGVANPRLVTPAVARAASRSGTRIVEQSKVIGVEVSDRGFLLAIHDGGRVRARRLVNCAGAWANELAERIGNGEKAPMIAAGPPQFVTEPLPFFMRPSVQAVDGKVICRQVGRGNVVVAGYPRGASDIARNRAEVPPHKTLATFAELVTLVPVLAGASAIRVWSGIEGYISDMLPVIGTSMTTKNLFHAFGFCGHGFQLGPGVGAVMSELVAGRCNGYTDRRLLHYAIYPSRLARPDQPCRGVRRCNRIGRGLIDRGRPYDVSVHTTHRKTRNE